MGKKLRTWMCVGPVLAMGALVAEAGGPPPPYNRRMVSVNPVPTSSDPMLFDFVVRWEAASFPTPIPRNLSSLIMVRVNGTIVGSTISMALSDPVQSCCPQPPGEPCSPEGPPLCLSLACTIWNSFLTGLCDPTAYPGFETGLCQCTGDFMATVPAAVPLVAGDVIAVDLRRASIALDELFIEDDGMETAFDDGPPQVVHGDGSTPVEEHAYSGYIDPRLESTDGSTLDLGMDEVRLVFSEPVRNAGGLPLSESAFTIVQTGGQPPPVVIDVLSIDFQSVTVRLNRPLSPREWTTVRAQVEDMIGVPIPNNGDLGPDIVEFDRLDLSFLPGDVDQDGVVAPVDLLRFRQGINGSWKQPAGALEDYIDTDRTGVISPVDLLRYRQLIMGTGNATQSWAGETISTDQP